MDSNKEKHIIEKETDPEKLKEQRKNAKEEKKQAKEKAKEKKQEKTVKPEIIKEKEKVPVNSKVQYYTSEAKLVRHNLGEPILYKENEKNILITSALPYVNNVPHLGNLIGCVLSADVIARYSRLVGNNTLYICGTDEYGTATETKALEEKCTPQELCDKFHHLHKGIYEWFDIDFDHFGRTSTPVHTKITHEIFNNLNNSGFIRKKEIEQYKCPNCNIFLADRFIIGTCYHKPCTFEEARGDQCDACGKLINATDLINPKCKICKGTPQLAKSSHFFLELPDVESKLKEWVDKASEEGSWSNNSKTITNAFMSDGLKPRCITRDLKWGVDVPTEDPEMKDKVFYVWFDAPIGYISITANFVGEENWRQWWKNPEGVKLYQFMGKDNVTFHTVIFPSTLIGTGEKFSLVHHLSTTEYLNYENKKFSKTHNTGVFGDQAKTTGIPSEVWRYYLLAVRPEQSDTDFKWTDFVAKNNNELLANLGNLINRVLAFLGKYYKLTVPKAYNINEKDIEFFKVVEKHVLEYVKNLENVKIKDGLRVFMELSSHGNGYFQENAPWELIKTDPERCDTVMNILANFVRLLGCLAEPYMPSFSAKLYELLNIKYDFEQSRLLKTIIDYIKTNPENSHMFLLKLPLINYGTVIREPLPLFKKSKYIFSNLVNEEEVEEFKKIYG